MVQKLMERNSSHLGHDVFKSTLMTVYQKFKPSHCFIAAVEASNKQATTYCYLEYGQETKNFSYDLSDVPYQLVNCEEDVYCLSPEIRKLFPDHIVLAKLNTPGYLGMPIRSDNNDVIGLLVCLFEHPIDAQSAPVKWLSGVGSFIAQEMWQQQSKRLLLKQLEAGESLAKIASWRWDVANDTFLWSNQVHRIFDIQAARELSFKGLYQIVHPHDREQFKQIAKEIVCGSRDKYDVTHRVLLANSKVKHLHWLADVVKSDDGKPAYLEGTVQDVTYRHESNIDKKLSDFIIKHSSESVMVTNNQNEIILVNQAMEQLTGYSQQEMVGRNPNMLSSGKQTDEFYQQMWTTLNSKGYWKGEIWNKCKNGRISPGELSLKAVTNEQGDISHYVSIFRDISQWKATEQRLQFLADNDSLTGLINRRCFIEKLEQQLAVASDDSFTTIVFIDLDQFKSINDIYGHQIGDSLLCEVASRLAGEISDNELLCRYGGDEFTLLIPDTSRAHTELIVKRVRDCFQHFFKLKQLIVETTASIGVAMSPDAGTSAKLLLRHANHAMFNAKNTGRNCISFHDIESQRRYQYKLELKERLKLALEQRKLEVFYQPIVNIESSFISKFEALVRWPDGNGGYISPAEFIPIAEEFGLIHLVGKFVLRQACADLKLIHQCGFGHISFSVNRSISEFYHGELEQQSIASAIKTAGLPYDSIIIEITESTAMSENRSARQALAELKHKGIKIALDDFCTGYSSLNYLIDYEVDIIKIDRSFVNAIESDKNSQILTSTVIELASKLGIEVIAEGVENVHQMTFLRQNGCQYIQGFYYSPALPINRCIDLLEENARGAIWEKAAQ